MCQQAIFKLLTHKSGELVMNKLRGRLKKKIVQKLPLARTQPNHLILTWLTSSSLTNNIIRHGVLTERMSYSRLLSAFTQLALRHNRTFRTVLLLFSFLFIAFPRPLWLGCYLVKPLKKSCLCLFGYPRSELGRTLDVPKYNITHSVFQ